MFYELFSIVEGSLVNLLLELAGELAESFTLFVSTALVRVTCSLQLPRFSLTSILPPLSFFRQIDPLGSILPCYHPLTGFFSSENPLASPYFDSQSVRFSVGS